MIKKHHRDIEILRDGPICMYRTNRILNEDVSWFSDHNFEVIDMDCRSWTKGNFHQKLKEQLFFPDYYGMNLDAFQDCLSDMFNKKYRGLIFVFRGFDNLVDQTRSASEGLLDSIARTSREWLLDGHKLICLIQSNVPNLSFSELGGLKPSWNGNEWLDNERDKDQ